MMGAEVAAGGRHAFLMELDELYCDVIVRRWQQFTGRQATLEGGGSYDQVAAERATPQCQKGLLDPAATAGAEPSPTAGTASATSASTDPQPGARPRRRRTPAATAPGGGS
jgi:hypothetical protein